jgi:hypothetical protein
MRGFFAPARNAHQVPVGPSNGELIHNHVPYSLFPGTAHRYIFLVCDPWVLFPVTPKSR